MKVKLFVEGGGDAKELRTRCREGFTKFITEAGLKNRPQVVACGSRRNAYESYCRAIQDGDSAVLLVDSEALVDDRYQQAIPATWQPWRHLKNRQGDEWDKPANAPDTDCHLMAQCMESWFLADRQTLKSFFGQGFSEGQLPAVANPLELVAKTTVYSSLANATKNCKTKSQYGKGEHSFTLLGKISPAAVTASSPWAKRFIDELKKKMDT